MLPVVPNACFRPIALVAVSCSAGLGVLKPWPDPVLPAAYRGNAKQTVIPPKLLLRPHSSRDCIFLQCTSVLTLSADPSTELSPS